MDILVDMEELKNRSEVTREKISFELLHCMYVALLVT